MRYKHDCQHCVPLGEFERYDLYYCNHQCLAIPTVLARYGHEGYEYSSGLFSRLPEIMEAKDRARKQGFLP